MYTITKGLVAQGYINPAVIDDIYWQDDFDDAIVAQQADGHWSGCPGYCWPGVPGDCNLAAATDVLCTVWALLVLQKAVPPPPEPEPEPPPGPVGIRVAGLVGEEKDFRGW
jgi:hypothetical protein